MNKFPSLIDPGGYYPPGFDGYLPGEARDHEDGSADYFICEVCGEGILHEQSGESDTLCNDCWDEEIDAEGGVR